MRIVQRQQRKLTRSRSSRVILDIGITKTLPARLGLLAWTIAEEAFEIIQRIERDCDVHARKARTLALDHFDDSTVLTHLFNRL